jgi:AraC-like DNA-binding protein
MTRSCSPTTNTPLQGHVALPYWKTLQKLAEELLTEEPAVKPELTNTETNKMIDHSGLSSIPVEHYIGLLESGFEQYPDFGLRVGKSVTPGTYPVLGMTLLSCQNLLQVLEQVVRYECLNHDLGSSRLAHGPQESTYSWIPNDLIFPNNKSELCFQLVVSIFSGIHTFSPWLINRTIPFKQINFTCKEPANSNTYKHFFDTKIKFNQKTNSMVVDSQILDWPVLNGDTTAFEALKSYADKLLDSKSHNQDIIFQLKSILPEALRRQSFRIDELAKQLNMSPRTLQRKLKETGHSYKTLLDETRQRVAELYLADDTLSMNEIAFLVGYQEQSSFNHAFKSWNSISPSVYRHNKLAKHTT